MKISEIELRKLIREELDGNENPLARTTFEPPPMANKSGSGVRMQAHRGPAESGPLNLSSVIDAVNSLTEQVSALLMNSTQTPDEEWAGLQVPNRISNKIMKAIRLEVDHITRELEMEDHNEW